MGTRSSGDSPRRKRATLAIAIRNARSTAARLPPARCGVTITWGKSAKGLPPGRSLDNTSSAAPPVCHSRERGGGLLRRSARRVKCLIRNAPRWHFCQLGLANQSLGGLIQWEVQADDRGRSQQVVERG